MISAQLQYNKNDINNQCQSFQKVLLWNLLTSQFTAANGSDLKVYCDQLYYQSNSSFQTCVHPSWLCYVRYSYTEEAGLVPRQIGLRLPMFPQVFYYPWAKGIMWLVGDALCSAHYYPDAVSMSSLTAHYDLLYTSTLQRPLSSYTMSHSCCAQAWWTLTVRGLQVKFHF